MSTTSPILSSVVMGCGDLDLDGLEECVPMYDGTRRVGLILRTPDF